MEVRSILTAKSGDLATVRPDDQLALALHLMTTRGIGCVVVVEDEKVVGVLGERDVVRALAHHGADIVSMRVRAVLAPTFSSCSPRDDLTSVMRQMTRSRQRHLPVTDHGRLVGLVSIGDIVKHRLEDLELEANVLRDVYVAKD